MGKPRNVYCHGLLATTIHVPVHVQRVSLIRSITVLLLSRSNGLVVPILDDWPPARVTPQRGIISSTYFMFSDHTAKDNNRTVFVCFFLLFLYMLNAIYILKIEGKTHHLQMTRQFLYYTYSSHKSISFQI